MGNRIHDELVALASKRAMTKGIARVLLSGDFPVDIRHNAKINRELLARWAAGELGF